MAPKDDSSDENLDTQDLTKLGEVSARLAEGLQDGTESSPQLPDVAPPTEQVDDFAPLDGLLVPAESSVANEAVAFESPVGDAGFGDILAPSETPAPDAMQQVREFAESIVRAPDVPASFPFTVRIEGHLAPAEREKLTDLLSRENMGIREVDLEPQFLAGRVLLPRVSEFAAVLIVQAMRGISARISVAPTEGDELDQHYSMESSVSAQIDTDPRHPAEAMPITRGEAIPGMERYCVLDVITASAALKSNLVEAETSAEFQQAVEALQRELRYKAYHRGAIAILNYSVQLTSLHLPSHYRVMVSGTAIKAEA